MGTRRAELEQTGDQFLDPVLCDPVPEGAGDFYATLKPGPLNRYSHGVS
jgi:hypothetical protein